MKAPTPKQLAALPAWARNYIASLSGQPAVDEQPPVAPDGYTIVDDVFVAQNWRFIAMKGACCPKNGTKLWSKIVIIVDPERYRYALPSECLQPATA
jgi:RNA polymerase subunit RPABC4/transcription elongation factor Spt4